MEDMEAAWSRILFETGEHHDLWQDAVSPPIYYASNFCAPSFAALQAKLEREFDAPFYTRGVNPTVSILREKLAALEQAEDALLFSSGSAAISAAVLSLVHAGQHVLCVEKPYSWTYRLLEDFLIPNGVEVSYYSPSDSADLQPWIRPNTRMIIAESPNSLTFEVSDLSSIARVAKANGCLTLADNSFSTPLLQLPLTMGFDLVAHSATKYLSGHSDVVAGALMGSKQWIRPIQTTGFMTLGASPNAMDAWLILRGLRTLPLRVMRSCDAAEALIDAIKDHPAVEKIAYPGLESHPGHAWAKNQMRRFGGMCSIYLNARNFEDVEAFCDALKVFKLACSWGSYESLLLPMAAYAKTPETYHGKTPWNVVRVYAGLEDMSLQQQDMLHALDKLAARVMP